LDVLVVGAGSLASTSSIACASSVFEAGSDIGGVWYWNCYPGARWGFSAPGSAHDLDLCQGFGGQGPARCILRSGTGSERVHPPRHRYLPHPNPPARRR
jgi:hypothetical protein